MLRSCSTAGYEMIWTEKYSHLIKKWKICIYSTNKSHKCCNYLLSVNFLYLTRTPSELVHIHITKMVLFWFSDIFNNIMYSAWNAWFYSYIITKYKSITYASCRKNKTFVQIPNHMAIWDKIPWDKLIGETHMGLELWQDFLRLPTYWILIHSIILLTQSPG